MAGIQIDGANQKLYLDSDADTYFEAATDDTIKVYVAGAHDLTISANAINVLSGTTLTIDSGATITNSGTASGFVSADPSSADGDTLGTASLEWSDLFLADGGIIKFGNDQDITLTHNADTGLTLNGVMVATTVEPSADTAAGDNAAIGYTSAEGLILTGQGSTNDVTIKNDADADVITIATGATNVDIVGDVTASTVNADGDTAAGDNAAIGYTSAEGLILTGQGSTDDVTIKNDADTTVLQVATGGVDVEITAGNIIMGTSGKGIDFSATGDTAASGSTTAAELFDDYEEGTWTVTLDTGGTDPTMNTSYDLMNYTKVGRLVSVSGHFVIDSVTGMAAGGCTVGTLPFNVSSSGGEWADRLAGCLSPEGLTGTLTNFVHIKTGSNYTYMALHDGVAGENDIAVHLQAASGFAMQMTYPTDA